MSLPVNDKIRYWGLAGAVFFAVLWVLSDILLPFVLGVAIAYFLDPVADRLERCGLSRTLAVILITLGAVLTFVLAALLIMPSLIQQAVLLIETGPQLARDFQAFLGNHFPSLMDSDSMLGKSLTQFGASLQSRGGAFAEQLLSSAVGLVNLLVLLVIVPVVGVYLLLDWDHMTARIDQLLPRYYAPTIRRLAAEIDQTLASFVRGMGTVCIILGTYYAVALMVIGLDFGLVVGFVAGLLTFIPYLGALIGGVLAIGLALFQFWGDWGAIMAVGVVFWLGQVCEGNVLTPRLVGHSVGLHPVWLIFAMSVFGTFFGFVGLLVAVPVAAALGVIVRFFISQYEDSRLYKG